MTEISWPADRVERRPIESLTPYARNARTHSDRQVAEIAASIQQWGWTIPILVDEAGMIIAGHGRVLAANRLGITEVPVMIASGWTEAQKRAYVVADNKLTLNAGWDEELLRVELGALDDMGFDMSLLGFGEDVLATLMSDEEPPAESPTPNGGLLRLAEVSIGEPSIKPNMGETWRLGPHVLVLACPLTEWRKWIHHLDGDDVLFAPYAGIYAPFTKLEGKRLVMVQPDTFTAGHMLDRWHVVHGDEQTTLMEVAA